MDTFSPGLCVYVPDTGAQIQFRGNPVVLCRRCLLGYPKTYRQIILFLCCFFWKQCFIILWKNIWKELKAYDYFKFKTD
jgi:hypothetical protein